MQEILLINHGYSLLIFFFLYIFNAKIWNFLVHKIKNQWTWMFYKKRCGLLWRRLEANCPQTFRKEPLGPKRVLWTRWLLLRYKKTPWFQHFFALVALNLNGTNRFEPLNFLKHGLNFFPSKMTLPFKEKRHSCLQSHSLLLFHAETVLTAARNRVSTRDTKRLGKSTRIQTTLRIACRKTFKSWDD